LKITDQQIVTELKAGNTRIFGEVYKCFPMIRSMVLKNSGTEEDAKDLFQNALVIFYKNVQKPDFELTAKISSYLYSICDKNWKKILTRDKNRNHSNLENVDQGSEEMDIELKNEDRPSLAQYIRNVLQQIGEPCYSIILLHEFDKVDMNTIKERMGYANAHTARQQKYKCIQKLKKMIPRKEIVNYLA